MMRIREKSAGSHYSFAIETVDCLLQCLAADSTVPAHMAPGIQEDLPFLFICERGAGC